MLVFQGTPYIKNKLEKEGFTIVNSKYKRKRPIVFLRADTSRIANIVTLLRASFQASSQANS